MLRITLDLSEGDARRFLAAAAGPAPGGTILLPATATFARAAGRERPTLFIGSSTEGRAVAEAMQANLQGDCEVAVWTQGLFEPGRSYLETLLDLADRVDFAALVLSPDDFTTSRKVGKMSPRDNVLFELGLFMGALGRGRTFAVCEQTLDLKLPTDLDGISKLYYQKPGALPLRASLGGCCYEIKQAFERHRHR